MLPTQEDPFDQSFDSLEALAETINDVLGCPATIEDAHHRLVAYSSHDPQTDPARLATIVGRRVPENVISGLRRSGVIGQLAESQEPVRIPAIHEIGLNDRVAIAIRKNTEIIGYIWVVETEKKLDSRGLLQLKKAAQAARTKLVQLHMQRRQEEEGLKDFFWQLLTGHVKSEAAIIEKAEKLGLVLPETFHVLVLQFASELADKQIRQLLDDVAANRRIRVVLQAADKNELILLCAPSVRRQPSREYTESIVKLIGLLKVRFPDTFVEGGSGSMYQEYMLVEKSCQEARMALRIKHRFPQETKAFHFYADLGFYRFLPLLLEERQMISFRNPCLDRLREYDKLHNGELLRTLDVFLRHDGRVKDAADDLHVHANTLSYRIKRIMEICGIDLNDMDQKVTLYLDLKLEKLSAN